MKYSKSLFYAFVIVTIMQTWIQTYQVHHLKLRLNEIIDMQNINNKKLAAAIGGFKP